MSLDLTMVWPDASIDVPQPGSEDPDLIRRIDERSTLDPALSCRLPGRSEPVTKSGWSTPLARLTEEAARATLHDLERAAADPGTADAKRERYAAAAALLRCLGSEDLVLYLH